MGETSGTANKDHIKLQSQIAKLVEENRSLTQQLKMAYEDEICKEVLSISEDQCDNLRQQLTLALTETDYIKKMWEVSLKELESLKEQLREHESGQRLVQTRSKLNSVQREYTEAIQILESKISALKGENDQLIARNILLEKQVDQSTRKINETTESNIALNHSLKNLRCEEQEWKSKHMFLEAKYLELEKFYQSDKVKFAHTYELEKMELQLKEKLESALRQRDELQLALERCHGRINELLLNASHDHDQIEEAVGLVEEALKERNEAHTREATSVEEVGKMKLILKKLVEEAGQRVGVEVALVRDQFNHIITTLKEELQLVKQERDRTVKEVQQWQQECERIQGLRDQPSETKSELGDHKRLIDEVYKELAFKEAECQQLQLENECLHESLIQLQERYKKKNREKLKATHNLKEIQEQYQACRNELAATAEKAHLLNRHLHQTNLEMTHLQGEAILHRDCAMKAQARVSEEQTKDMYKCFDDSYKQMNNRWKTEMDTLTEQFQAKLKQVKKRSNLGPKQEKNKQN